MSIEDQDPQGGPPDSSTIADPTPDPGTTFDWDTDDNPWKQRFEGYRPEADRKITRLSQYEQAVQDFQTGDPAEMRRAAAVLGLADHLEIEDPEPPTYDDPSDELRAELAALRAEQESFKGQLTAREAKEAEAAQVAEVNARLDKLAITDEQERNVVLGVAFTLPMDEQGLPDVSAAAKFVTDRDNARMRAWGDTKNAPRSIQPGSPATQQKNVADMSREEAINWAAERLDAMNAAD